MNPKPPNNRIGLPLAEGYHLIDLSEIIYCRADGNRTWVQLSDERLLSVNRSLKELESIFPDDFFFRTHHSNIVNLTHVCKWLKKDSGVIHMTNGHEIQVARSRRKALKTRLNLLGD